MATALIVSAPAMEEMPIIDEADSRNISATFLAYDFTDLIDMVAPTYLINNND
jgi:hypothetical protein